jgi:hypothetical protein
MKRLMLIAVVGLCGCSMFSEKDIVDLWNGYDWPVAEAVTNIFPVPGPVVSGDVTLPADEINPADISEVYSGIPLSKLVVNVGLKRVWKDNLFRWEYDRPCPWTKEYKGAIGNNWLFLKIDGKWVGGPSDWLRKGENYKNFGDVKFEHDKVIYRPKPGEQFGFMTSTPCRNGVMKEGFRSNIKLMVVK